VVSQKFITAPANFAAGRNQGFRYSLSLFDFEMRLWAVLRAGRVVQSQSSFLNQSGYFLGFCLPIALTMQR
jgi:hypothetical protein